MEDKNKTAEELKTIRKIMEESTKFLSLSGLSGSFLGLFAIAGAIVVYLLIGRSGLGFEKYISSLSVADIPAFRLELLIIAIITLSLSLITGFYFSLRKAKRSGVKFWSPVSKRLLASLFIPLVTGGILALILFSQDQYQLIIPVFLIFYGLAFISGGKFTYNELFYLGMLEIITGLVSALIPSLALIFWIIGFGIFHIVYGIFLYRKYES